MNRETKLVIGLCAVCLIIGVGIGYLLFKEEKKPEIIYNEKYEKIKDSINVLPDGGVDSAFIQFGRAKRSAK